MPIDYYNDNDPGAAAWLEALCAAGEIPAGTVDKRSILDVRADELSRFRRVHFFAGIGGWAEALRIARWPADVPVWTGSPPCQPFSVAGKGLSQDDPRHLAPHFAGLVGAGCPLMLFGEQVAGAEVLGKISKAADRQAAAAPAWAWSDDLQDRLEGAGYAYGAADLCSAGIGAPHIRQRLFFGAFRRDALGFIRERLADHYGDGWSEAGGGFTATGHDGAFGDGAAGGLVDGQRARLEGLGGDGDRGGEPGRIDQIPNRPAAATGAAGGVADREGERWNGGEDPAGQRRWGGPQDSSPAGGMADANRGQCDGVADGERCQRHGTAPGRNEGDGLSAAGSQSGIGHNRPGPLHGFWRDADWLFCRDERWRPVEPIDERMAYGVSIALDARLFEVVDAQTRQILAAETLRAMRNGHDPQAIWGSVGGCCGFPAASVLLAILCEHTGALGHFQHFWPTSGEKDRIARHLQQVWLRFGALAGPPSGRGFSEQLARQLGNSLPKLPRKGAPPRWRALTMLTAGPLAENVSDRVGLLRGYGNAINPHLAAAFIEAFARSIIDIGGGNA